eukprot:3495107-Amphidinium_carterae.1
MAEAFPRWTFEHPSFANAAEHWVYALDLHIRPSLPALYTCLECAIADVKNDRDSLSLNPFVQQGALVACIHACMTGDRDRVQSLLAKSEWGVRYSWSLVAMVKRLLPRLQQVNRK